MLGQLLDDVTLDKCCSSKKLDVRCLQIVDVNLAELRIRHLLLQNDALILSLEIAL